MALPVTWNSITRRVTTQLQAESFHRASEMEHWLGEATSTATLVSSDIGLHFSAERTPTTDDEAALTGPSLADETDRLRVFRDALDNVMSVSLLDPADGRVLASTEPTLVSRGSPAFLGENP